MNKTCGQPRRQFVASEEDFAAVGHKVRPAGRTVDLELSPDSYYQDPLGQATRLYDAFRQA